MNAQAKAFDNFLESEKGKSTLDSVKKNINMPYAQNILWWAFNMGYEAGIEDYKNEKLYFATRKLVTASERRKAKLLLKKLKGKLKTLAYFIRCLTISRPVKKFWFIS